MTDCCQDDTSGHADTESGTEPECVTCRLARIEQKIDSNTGILQTIVSNLAWIVTNVQGALTSLASMPGIGGMLGRKAVKK